MAELKFLKLNIIVPTYNRADLLRRTLQSLAQAERSPSLEVVVTVADNNSTDDTKKVVAEFAPLFVDIKLEYLFEKRQGRSFALNSALAKSDADLVSTVDDDEEISSDWYLEVAEIFGSRWNELDFASGKMLPRWETSPPPSWASPDWSGIGWRDYGEQEWTHTAETPIVCGGHAIFKLSLFHELGFYIEGLGATGKNLMSCEDDVFYDQLITAGKHGIYNPRLVIWHFVPNYRLTRNYLRQWSYGNGASQHLVDVYYKPFTGKRLLGVPRYLYREAASSTGKMLFSFLRGKRDDAFAAERQFWLFWGYFYARNIQDSRLDSPLKSLAAKILAPANR